MIHVVGYALAVSSPDNGWRGSSVLLIEKTHPTWQAGRLNGLGGKVESGEIPADAMAREFKQETCGRLVGSRLYRREGWRHFATLAGADWQCAFFVGFLNGIDVTAMHGRMSDEGERLVETSLQDVHPANGRILQSCLWLIPMATQLDAYAPGSLPIVISEAAPGALRKAQRDRRSLIR